jgi:hypothetical protein
MARARNIKPGIFKNEVLGVADPLLTLLFEGLWLLADREGRLEDRPLRIKGEVFPYREGVDVASMLSWLGERGFILRYEANGLALIQIIQFRKHQSPHKNETASEYPPPENFGGPPDFVGSTRADCLIADSLNPDRDTPPRRKSSKTTLPADFGITDRVREWAKEKGYGQLDQHLEAFKRKAIAKGYEYASWDDAFMEAIREDWAKLRGRMTDGTAPPAMPARGPDPALEKLKADANRAAPPPQAIREQMAQITRKFTGKESA